MKKQIPFLALSMWLAVGIHLAANAYTAQDARNSLGSGDYDRDLRISKENISTAKSKEELVSYLTVMSDVYKYKRQDALSIPCLTPLGLVDKSDTGNLPFLHHKRGNAYSSVGNLQLALADYGAVVSAKIGPRPMINVLKDRALLYARMNQYDKAIADLNLSLKLTDSLLGARDAVSNIMRVRGDKVQLLNMRSKMYDKSGKIEEAKRDRSAADKLSDEL
jgi:tetratricopeptide (TPR) repeat protein